MRRFKLPSVFSISLLLISMQFLYETFFLGPAAAKVPMSILYVLIPLILIQVGIEFMPSLESLAEKLLRLNVGPRYSYEKNVIKVNDSNAEKAGSSSGGYIAVSLIFSVPAAILCIGFLPTMFVFYSFYLYKINGSRWYTALTVAALFTGAVYAFFERILQVTLYQGFLLPWMGL